MENPILSFVSFIDVNKTSHLVFGRALMMPAHFRKIRLMCGNYRYAGFYNSLQFTYNFLNLPERVSKGFMESNFSNWSPINNQSGNLMNYTQVSYYNMSDFAEAKRTFEFLADNSDVEWGMVSDSETNHIYTSHEAKNLHGDVNYLFGNNPFSHTHSHPNDPRLSTADKRAARQLPNTLFKIYHKKQYYIYGSDYFVPFSQFSFY